MHENSPSATGSSSNERRKEKEKRREEERVRPSRGNGSQYIFPPGLRAPPRQARTAGEFASLRDDGLSGLVPERLSELRATMRVRVR